jgi:uncharacterized protein (DUF433 family)
MELIETRYEHVVLDERGVPIIAGTRTKVIELIVERMAYGWSPEELHYQHPYLSLGQIFSALAYYADHSDELDRVIADDLEVVDKMRKAAGPSSLVKKLKAKGLL